MPRSAKSTTQFIKEITKIYGEQYDYSKIEYINNKIKILIGCKIHGFFEIHPHHLLKGQGCKKCSHKQRLLNNSKEETKKFIEKSKLIHSEKYRYEKVKYINSRLKIIITCIKHGDFEQRPNHHLKGTGCPECGLFSINKKRFTKEIQEQKTIELKQTLKDMFDDKYLLDKTSYNGANKQLTLTCPIEGHGDFIRRLAYLLKGNGCQKCLEIYYKEQSQIKELEKFKKKGSKIHKNKYDYSKSNYIDCKTNTIIICPKHGEFLQCPNSHLNGSGCKRCINKSESKLYDWLTETFPEYEITHQYKPDWLKPKSFDFFISELNLVIELDGQQHFEQVRNWKSPEEHQKIDAFKMKLAHKNNLTIMRIPRLYIFNRLTILHERLDKIKKYIKKQNKPIYIYFQKSKYNSLINQMKNMII